MGLLPSSYLCRLRQAQKGTKTNTKRLWWHKQEIENEVGGSASGGRTWKQCFYSALGAFGVRKWGREYNKVALDNGEAHWQNKISQYINFWREKLSRLARWCPHTEYHICILQYWGNDCKRSLFSVCSRMVISLRFC
jgi:hypothetical protein